MIDRERGELLAAARAVPMAQLRTRPGEGRWSIAENLAHLERVERGVVRLLTLRLTEARAQGHPAETDSSSIVGCLDDRGLDDRQTRRLAPPRVEPDPEVAAAEDLVERLERSRVQLREAASIGDGLALGSLHHPHPVLGDISLYEWIRFVGLHELRHRSQITEVVEVITHPSFQETRT